MCYTTRIRRGFTLFQLLLLLAILLILLGLLLPAIVKVRMAANRAQESNNLKQLGLAVQNCSDTHQGLMPPSIGVYPANVNGGGEGTLHFHLLPYIEQQNIYNLSSNNDPQKLRYRVSYKGTAAFPIKVFLAPKDPSAPPGNVYDGWLALCNYPLNYLVFGKGGNRFPASIIDGMSNTIFFAQRYQMCNGQPHAWGYDGWYYWRLATLRRSVAKRLTLSGSRTQQSGDFVGPTTRGRFRLGLARRRSHFQRLLGRLLIGQRLDADVVEVHRA
jgi:type II secretory pathway pseudopilin PulG